MPWNKSEGKSRRWCQPYPQCVLNRWTAGSKERRWKLWWPSTCIRGILLRKSSARTSTTSTGKNRRDFTGRLIRTIALFRSLIGIKFILMNSWEPKKDSASLLLLIDAISPLPRHFQCTTEVHLPDLQGLARRKQSRTWEEPWEYSWLSPTAQTSTDTRTWLRFSRDWSNQDFGGVSTSSIESIWKCFQSWQCKSKPSLLRRNSTWKNSCSQKNPCRLKSTTLLAISSPWTQDTLEDRNCLKTSRPSSEECQWWCPIEKSLWRSSSPQSDTLQLMPFPKSSMSFTNFAKSNSANKDITTLDWGTFYQCWERPETQKDKSWNQMKKCFWWGL